MLRSSFSPKEAERLVSYASVEGQGRVGSPTHDAEEALPQPLSVDEALERSGGWSHYQQRLTLWLGLGTATCAVHMLQPIFLLPLIDWELSNTARGLITTFFFAGYAVGVLPWAHVSDQRGRRPTIIVALLVGNVGGIGSFFAPGLYSFLLLRFVCGVGIAGAKNALFLLATEFAPPAARAQVSARIAYAWVFGLFFLVAVAYALRGAHWRWLLVAHAPGLLFQVALPSLLPESPRFHLVDGDPERALLTMRAVFKANHRAAPEPLCLQQPPERAAGRSRSTAAQLWARGTRRATGVIGYAQFVCTMVFYAITFSTELNSIGGNLYVGALFGALIELPAYAALAPATNRLGRRAAYAGFMLVAALACVALQLQMPHTRPPAAGANATAAEDVAASAVRWGAMAAVLCGRFASVASVNVGYIVSAEIFPTSCRNSGIGWGTGCGRIGAMLAPHLMVGLERPLLLFALLCVAAAATVWQLPESAGAYMVDVPEDERVGCEEGAAGSPRGPDSTDGFSVSSVSS